MFPWVAPEAANLRVVLGLAQIAHNVKDVEQSVQFYRDNLGLTFLFSAGPNLAFFDLWGVRLMLSSGDSPPTGNSTLYLKVPDINRAYEEGRGTLEFVDQPHLVATVENTEIWMVFLTDPDGNLIGLTEERKVGP